jgi:hypothetical protein
MAVKKYVAKELQKDQNEVAFWKLVGGNWKKDLREFLLSLEESKIDSSTLLERILSMGISNAVLDYQRWPTNGAGVI